MAKKTKEYYIQKLLDHGDKRAYSTLNRKSIKELKSELLRYEKPKVGRPKIIESPEKLLELFLEYYEQEDKDKLITIISFMMYVVYEKKLVNQTNYWYELTDEFSSAKKEIENIIEQRYIEVSTNKDNATSFLIFYAKNKFGYTDKQQIEQTTKQSVTIVNDLEEE